MTVQRAIQHREYMRAYQRRHAQAGLCVECHEPLATKLYCRGCADRRAALSRAYRSKPEVKQKRVARESVRKAVKRGALVKPSACERCGRTDVKLHAHHKSYEPEARRRVEWICPTCHGAEHAKWKAA